jgi:hypothetical protein
MDKKQTAVEWLMEHITYDNGYGQRWVSFKEATDLNIYFQKALSMEKEQIIDAYEIGFDEGLQIITKYDTAQDYYNETYGK